MKVTVKTIMDLDPCMSYTRRRVANLLRKGSLVDALESIPYEDARWVIARLLNQDNREHWAYACADRAARYYAEAQDNAAIFAIGKAANTAAEAARDIGLKLGHEVWGVDSAYAELVADGAAKTVRDVLGLPAVA